MITKERLQEFVDKNLDRIVQILPGGLKDKNGKWILVCPVMERFNLDFSKVKGESTIEEAEKPKKTRKSKKK